MAEERDGTCQTYSVPTQGSTLDFSTNFNVHTRVEVILILMADSPTNKTILILHHHLQAYVLLLPIFIYILLLLISTHTLIHIPLIPTPIPTQSATPLTHATLVIQAIPLLLPRPQPLEYINTGNRVLDTNLPLPLYPRLVEQPE
jgi:hypothetical protein